MCVQHMHIHLYQEHSLSFNLKRAMVFSFFRSLSIKSAPLVLSASLLYPSREHSYSAEESSPVRPHQVYDIAVIGGGVVGLAVARACSVQCGAKVVVLEREDAVGAGVSARNSGLGCTGYDAPVGSLERQLLRRSIQLHPNLYRSFGLSSEHVRKCGSVIVAWTPAERDMLPMILEENRLAGDMDAVLLSQEELRRLEPSLSHDALGAVYCPYEAVVEPWLVPVGYAESARLSGVEFRTSTEVVSARRVEGLWCLDLVSSGVESLDKLAVPNTVAQKTCEVECEQAGEVRANVVINCAGLFGDAVESMLSAAASGESNSQSEGFVPKFTVTPRKGQFVIFRGPKEGFPAPGVIIEPVATEYTKGVIIWTTLYGNIVVGPTAEDVEHKDDFCTDSETVCRLRKFGESRVPGLKDAEVVGTYCGLRPATEHRDYNIYSSTTPLGGKWITVGGIRSTGLTASSGIGEYVAQLYCSDHVISRNESCIHRTDKEDGITSSKTDGLIGVSESAESPLPLHTINRFLVPLQSPPPRCTGNDDLMCSEVPSLKDLAADYASNSRYVKIYGRLHRVTHPISYVGMKTLHYSPEK